MTAQEFNERQKVLDQLRKLINTDAHQRIGAFLNAERHLAEFREKRSVEIRAHISQVSRYGFESIQDFKDAIRGLFHELSDAFRIQFGDPHDCGIVVHIMRL